MKSGEPTGEKAMCAAGYMGAVAALTMTAPAAVAEPTTPPPPSITVQAAEAPAAPPEGVPHLPSPENLPPGTTDTPTEPPEGRGLAYLRDLWHTYQTQEITGADALLLLTQRPLDPNAAPPPGVPAGPQPPGPAALPPTP